MAFGGNPVFRGKNYRGAIATAAPAPTQGHSPYGQNPSVPTPYAPPPAAPAWNSWKIAASPLPAPPS